MKTKKKKSPKAVTLLTRIGTLLSDAIDECSAIEKSVERNVRDLLVSAQSSILSARDYVVKAAPSFEVRKKPAKRKAKPAVKAKKRPAARKRVAA